MHNGGSVRGALRDAVAVLVDAARLVVRHWPVLLALALAGVAVRGAAHWTAVEVSDHVPWLGHLLIVFAPLGYLVPVIAMLHVCRPDLPAVLAADRVPTPEDPTSRHDRRLLDVAASVLVPFLTVYVAHGLLTNDLRSFVNSAVADEFNSIDLSGREATDFGSRAGLYPLTTVLVIVLVAVVLRYLLARTERLARFTALALLGALVEVYYTTQVGRLVDAEKADARTWVEERRFVSWAQTSYDDVTGRLGWLAHPVDTVTAWVFGVLGSFDALVVVPLAWLTVAAVVLGHKLAPPAPVTHPVLDRLSVVPAPVRKGLGNLTTDVRSRFTGLFHGLRLLARAGLVPMLLFCLAYLVALRVPPLFAWLVRTVTGPVDGQAWLAFAPIESAIGTALSMVTISVLLAAATDRVLLTRPAAPAEPGSPVSPTTAAPG